MEFKHFSHIHGLSFHQIKHGTESHCSGCRSPCSASTYVCWQCNFFLHEQCFQASRSIIHPSHPSHPLTLIPYPTYPSSSFYCNSCNSLGIGFSYSCAHCEFDLHLQCAKLSATSNSIAPPECYPSVSSYPNHLSIPSSTNVPPECYPSIGHDPNHPIPNQTLIALPAHGSIQNVSIPNYPLHNQTVSLPVPIGQGPARTPGTKHFSHNHELLIAKVEEKDGKLCSGCEKSLVGWAYRCGESPSPCNFFLHQSCFKLAREINHKSHMNHLLTLLPNPPYKEAEFTCNACLHNGKAFTYNCSSCNFDIHVECASLPQTVIRKDHDHPLNLFHSSPIKKAGDEQNKDLVFVCDVCQENVPDISWVYYCQKCDFGTHVDCVDFQAKPKPQAVEKSEVELILETQSQLEKLHLLMQLQRQGAKYALDLVG